MIAENPTASKIMELLRVKARGRKQFALAAECGVDPSDFNHFLKGDRTLAAFGLANLADILGLDVPSILLASDLWQGGKKFEEPAKRGSQERGGRSRERDRGWRLAQDAYESLLRERPSSVAVPRAMRTPGTLIDWRDWLFPTAVFVGDRREDAPPRSPADLLAASGSCGDLFNFARLQLPADTEILSDKSCLLATEDSLRRRFRDKNLLVVGSPAANLVARAINGSSCFSFSCLTEALMQEKKVREDLEQIKFYPKKMTDYAEEHRATLRRMIFGFARSGILDPVDSAGLRGIHCNSIVDFGSVSICRNPWSETHVAVLAAGLHAPGTAMAVKLLAEPQVFASHPLGGVFKVHVPIESPWEDRFRQLSWEWDTHDYSIEKYTDDFGAFAAALKGQHAFWEPDKVRTLLSLIKSHNAANVDGGPPEA